MTVRELIEGLLTEDPDRVVVMAKDGEGNGYSPLSSWWTGAYVAETTWYGEVGLETLTEEDQRRGYSEKDVKVGGMPALILSPVN